MGTPYSPQLFVALFTHGGFMEDVQVPREVTVEKCLAELPSLAAVRRFENAASIAGDHKLGREPGRGWALMVVPDDKKLEGSDPSWDGVRLYYLERRIIFSEGSTQGAEVWSTRTTTPDDAKTMPGLRALFRISILPPGEKKRLADILGRPRLDTSQNAWMFGVLEELKKETRYKKILAAFYLDWVTIRKEIQRADEAGEFPQVAPAVVPAVYTHAEGWL